MNTDKRKKIESLIIQLISRYMLNDLKELELEFWIINISWVKLSSELSYLDVYVSCFLKKDQLTKTLAEYAYILKKKLNKDLTIRKIPIIRFRYDQSWEISQEITKSINNLK